MSNKLLRSEISMDCVSTRRAAHFHSSSVCVEERPWRPEEDASSPHPLCCIIWAHAPYWELNLNPLQEQQMLLNTKSSLQP